MAYYTRRKRASSPKTVTIKINVTKPRPKRPHRKRRVRRWRGFGW